MRRRLASANPLVLFVALSAAALIAIGLLIAMGGGRPHASAASNATRLTMYCAAGVRPAVEAIARQYEDEYGVHVRLEYGGSNTLLSRIEVSQTGDIYLAADHSYTDRAREKGLVAETIPLATMRPVILVAGGNPKQINAIDDLLRDDVRVALGNPDQAAIGKKTRQLLEPSGQWQSLKSRVEDRGVFKPTVPEIANDVEIGSVDAAIVWDAVAALYPNLETVCTPELDAGAAEITLGVIATCDQPAAALRFCRYLAARDRGLEVFAEKGYDVISGDRWEETPQLTFFAGSVNRHALEPIVNDFMRREGVDVNTVYNGCGILTAQMRTMQADGEGVFPDVYMACDVYYLETVADLFAEGVNISNTDIVIAVQKGNPKQIESLSDLLRPGVRVALGQPDQCTIGVLSRRLLESAEIYDTLLSENVVTQTATSALLIPSITTGSADAALVYRTDTLAESDRVDAIDIDSPFAKAVQPFSIALSSPHKQLASRLYAAIARAREQFEASGFVWQLSDTPVAN